MAYDQTQLCFIGYGNGFGLWAYNSTTDTIATILAGSYFQYTPLARVGTGDQIFITASDSYTQATVTGNDGSYLTVQTYSGNFHEPLFADYLLSGFALGQGANSPSLTELRDGIFLNAFAGSGQEDEGFFNIHMLHDYKAGTDMTFHIHWTHNNATPSGDVKWGIDYTIAKGYSIDTFGAPISLSTTQTAGVQYTHHITSDDDMIISATDDLEPDSMIIGRVYRDPGDVEDTFGDNAFLITLDIHYQKGQIGTIERNRPFTSAGF